MTYLNMQCRGCGETKVRQFLDLGDQPHCNRLIPPEMADKREPHFPLHVGFCETCTMVQIDYTIPKEDMFSNYPYVSGTTKTLTAHFKETAERLAKTYGLNADSLVVDIGSNDGTWLKQYQPLGIKVHGVEPAANVVELALSDGVPTTCKFFNKETAAEVREKYGPASLVTAAGVFFHLEELHSVIEGVKLLLKDDGVFVVQAIYLGGMVDNIAFDQVYHEHLVYYTLNSIESLFARHGLEVFDASLVPIHGGSIEVHVAPKGQRPVKDSVVMMRHTEAKKGYGRLETYEAFAANVWQLRDDLLALLRKYNEAGKSVYAFGAPAKGATLLNSFGIGPDLVAFATERNPIKVGRLMPGSRIPIIDEKGQRPDAFLVLAWNFIDEFVARETAYLEAGGEFIVPVPKLRVIGRDKT
ncbi:NDP-hexose 3-C-methyltransferase [Roseibium aquae]|uniref:NDP-hexose 3-C-methyltransferase n=1 Tax=Roseibium aquae TaxID=1323746 RepID=A0A916TNU6_9HYPH|nr:class I SAM-dependent methyltransferase [Roseibium aquae]GGB64007.1 NDP-hexose 3-C-methyltransferase [Roseibium aquae]